LYTTQELNHNEEGKKRLMKEGEVREGKEAKEKGKEDGTYVSSSTPTHQSKQVQQRG
jgi:hypothetical protein